MLPTIYSFIIHIKDLHWSTTPVPIDYVLDVVEKDLLLLLKKGLITPTEQSEQIKIARKKIKDIKSTKGYIERASVERPPVLFHKAKVYDYPADWSVQLKRNYRCHCQKQLKQGLPLDTWDVWYENNAERLESRLS